VIYLKQSLFGGMFLLLLANTNQ